MAISKARGHVRIIGGQWRGRQVKVVAHGSLRPTPDFVRETIFNWLTGYVQDARCLDLFAGTGVLGFEALSRGAKFVTFVDNFVPAIKEIAHSAKHLSAENHCETVLSDGVRWLKHQGQHAPYDLVFLDPPYASMFLYPAMALLAEKQLVHERTLIYAESDSELKLHKLPVNWQLLKHKVKGEVHFHLLSVSAS
jgi:16S rRNA (guanine966-N2)-methyltransferase